MTDLDAQAQECRRIARERCRGCQMWHEDTDRGAVLGWGDYLHTCRSDVEAVRELAMAAVDEALPIGGRCQSSACAKAVLGNREGWLCPSCQLKARLAALLVPPAAAQGAPEGAGGK